MRLPVRPLVLLLLLAGCAPRIAPADAAALRGAPVIAVDRLPGAKPHFELLIVAGRDFTAALTASILATRGTTTPALRGETLPTVSSNRWVRTEALPEEGPLLDPVDLLAAALLHRLEGDGLASPGSGRCASPGTCPEAELVLALEVTEQRLVIHPGPPGSALEAFKARATLRARSGREVWSGACDTGPASPAFDPRQPHIDRLQSLHDLASLRCADLLAGKLRAALEAR